MTWFILDKLIVLAINQLFGMIIVLLILSGVFSYKGLFKKLKHGTLTIVLIFGLIYNIFVFALFENYILANTVLFFAGIFIFVLSWRTRVYIFSKSKKLAESIKESI
ncbi:MAG: hypothetical protein J7K87_02670 [Candidatus Aenigmarchaeota archaeon]|nr:hypothetical protein [Candidatus Aenigmarchaeota archaeon]